MLPARLSTEGCGASNGGGWCLAWWVWCLAWCGLAQACDPHTRLARRSSKAHGALTTPPVAASLGPISPLYVPRLYVASSERPHTLQRAVVWLHEMAKVK